MRASLLFVVIACAVVGWAAWAVLGISLTVYAALVAHRGLQRVGAVRFIRMVSAHGWAWAYALEEHQKHVAKSRIEISDLETIHREKMEAIG